MQGLLFDHEQNPFDGDLPHQSRMPLNLEGRNVYSEVVRDLCNQWDALVVTGYSGLEQLIHLITSRGKAPTRISIVV